MTAPIATTCPLSSRRSPSPAELRERVDDTLMRFLDREAERFTTPSVPHQVFDLLQRFVLGGITRRRPRGLR